ncbi:MAG: hypothetical protein JNM24_10475 [Bdellovibrionaceae bacterium]|nr:hypothetical protein [Pseudobdellovibrionaceae bacterium]
MKIKVIVLSFLITAFLSLNFVVPQLIQEHLQAYMSDVRENAIKYGLEVTFEDVRLSYIPLRIRVNGLAINTNKGDKVLSTNNVDFSNWSLTEAIGVAQGEIDLYDLTKLKIAIQSLELNDQYLSPRLQKALAELGYQKLVLNVVSDYNYKSESKDFYLNELSVEGFKMGKLSVTAHLTDFILPEAFDLKDLSQFNESSVKEFSVEYVDNSLVANIKTLAQKNNVPLESYLALAKRAESNRDPANTNGDSEITSGLREFVNNPRSVKLAVTPEKEIPFKDISLMMMLSPNKLVESLQPSLQINGSTVQLYKGN